MSEPSGTVVHLAPHPDDEAIGAPGTLLKLQRAGWTIVDVVLSLGRPEDHARRYAEAADAASRASFELRVVDPPVSMSSGDDLGAAERRLVGIIEALVAECGPAVLVSPSPHDGHHGHEVVGRAVRAALVSLGTAPVWWMWGLWGDLPLPTLYVALDEKEMAEVLGVLDAYVGELERNDYRRLLTGRAQANAVLGSELVFGFGGPVVSDEPYAELLTEVVLRPTGWMLGEPRLLNAAAPLATASNRNASAWVERPSARQALRLGGGQSLRPRSHQR
jgi:LmbE family N-acetylglucosaminyl deacetylase